MPEANPEKQRAFPNWARIALGAALAYFLVAYVILPRLWKHHEMRHAVFDDSPRVTHTASGIPGDPLNIALVGTKEEVIHAMIAAKWDPADALTFRSSVRIAWIRFCENRMTRLPSVIFIFSEGKKIWHLKSLSGTVRKSAITCASGKWPRRTDDRPAWIGSAAYDIGVELSRTTGQVTHHISPDVDAERNLLVADLTKATAAQVDWLDKFHTQLEGRNGGGDPWRTDGRLAIVILPATQAPSIAVPTP